MSKQIHDKPEMLELLENDLILKIREAFLAAGIGGVVHGVFSLDHLETLTENDILNRIALGVGYLGAENSQTEKAPLNVGKGNAAMMSDFLFTILVAASSDALCNQRTTATRILTVLRQGILGRSVTAGEPQGMNSVQRTWVFVREKPEISESSDSMLYYTQVWRLALPMKGNQ